MKKENIVKEFKKIYKGKRLLAIRLDGFSHKVFYDNGTFSSDITSDGYSLYTDFENEKANSFFPAIGYNHHYSFKHAPEEIVFVYPTDR